MSAALVPSRCLIEEPMGSSPPAHRLLPYREKIAEGAMFLSTKSPKQLLYSYKPRDVTLFLKKSTPYNYPHSTTITTASVVIAS
jgi:hypothetical protein